MKKIVFASVAAVGIMALSGIAYATMMGHTAFGEMHEMKMGDKMMHVQLIEDSEGQWVVMSRAEAEAMFGPIDAKMFHTAGK
jgi:hypothetical protein